MLGNNSPAGILDRHRPTAEVSHLGAEFEVEAVQG